MIDNVARKNVYIKIRLRTNKISRALHGNRTENSMKFTPKWDFIRNRLSTLLFLLVRYNLDSCIYMLVNGHCLRSFSLGRMESFIPFHAKWNVTSSPFLLRVVSLFFFLHRIFRSHSYPYFFRLCSLFLYLQSPWYSQRERERKKNSGSFS